MAQSDLWLSYASKAFALTSKVKLYYKTHSTKVAPYIPVSTQGLLEIIQKVQDLSSIEILDVERSVGWKPKHFKSQILKSDSKKSAVIIIPSLKTDPDDDFGVTRCERRFAVVKEICHLLIDDPAPADVKISNLVLSIVNNAQMIFPVGITDPLILQEYFAELAALELLIWHEHWSDRFFKVNAGVLTDLCVAKEFLVPECKIASLRHGHEFIQGLRNNYNDLLDELVLSVSAMPARLSFDHDLTW